MRLFVPIFIFIYLFIFISWRLITLQYCSGFCHTLTWISHGFTCIPHPDSPSHSLSARSLCVFPVHQVRLCEMCGALVMDKNWARSVDQYWLQGMQFLVYLMDLLNILFRCNGFIRIQKSVVIRWLPDPQTVTMTFFSATFALGSALEFLLSPATELVIAGCHIKSSFHHKSQSDWEMVQCCCVE